MCWVIDRVSMVYSWFEMAYECLEMDANIIFDIIENCQRLTNFGTLDPLTIAEIL